MKAVPKVDLDGVFIEDVLVEDSFTGIRPVFALPVTSPDEDQGEPHIIAYLIGYPVSPGLYKPRWDTVTEKWVEALTPEEIEDIRNQPPTSSPVDQQIEELQNRLQATQDALDFILMQQMLKGGML